MPPPLLDAPHALGDARDDPAATTSETRAPSEDAETASSSPRSTDAEDESSRRETTETATETTASDYDDDDELPFVRNANALEPDPERFWRARLSSLSNSWMPRSVDREALGRRLNDAAARVADALPADLAESLAKALARAKSGEFPPSCAASLGWLTRRDATRAGEDGTARFETILGSIVSETRSVDEDAARSRSATSPADPASGVFADRGTANRGAFPRIFDAAAPAFLFVRGLYGEHYPCYQWDAVEHFRRRGAIARLSAAARGAGTTAANAAALCDEILAFADELGVDGAGNQRRVVLVGHSKGGVDACAALALYEHRLADVVLGVVTVQSPYGGSPIASDLTANKTLRGVTSRALETLLRAPRGEGARTLLPPLLDVTYENRVAFLEHHPLPDRFPCVSFHTRTSSNNSVLAVTAAYARKSYGEENDGLVCRVDAEVPGCVAVRWRAEFDHADGAYPRTMSDARYEAYRARIRPAGVRSQESGVAETSKAASREDEEKDEASREEAEKTRSESDPDAASNAMVPPAEARARALRTRDARREGRSTRRSTLRADGGFSDLPGFSGEFEGVLTGLARDIFRDVRRALDGECVGESPPDGSARDAETNEDDFWSSRRDAERRGDEAADADTSAPPPGAGTLLVRAYLALNAAVPERLASTADQGEIHEALASLLMERAENRREGNFGEW